MPVEVDWGVSPFSGNSGHFWREPPQKRLKHFGVKMGTPDKSALPAPTRRHSPGVNVVPLNLAAPPNRSCKLLGPF